MEKINTLVVSYNLACKQTNPKFYSNVDMVRMNSPWYTLEELEQSIKLVNKPVFLDVILRVELRQKELIINIKNF